MELSSIDRDRLAFLMEMDAAFDLEFKTLEALAGGEDGILTHPISVKFNYIYN